jgi:hypothetical protein
MRYNWVMTTILFAHFDGNTLVPDGPVDLPVGTALRIQVEAVAAKVEEPAISATPKVTIAPRRFQPLDIQIDPELSHAIALDPEFNIEES